MKVFIVGGTGLIGFEASRELLRRGHQVASVSSRVPSFSLPDGMTNAVVDFNKLGDDELLALLNGCEGVVFAAGVDERVSGPAPILDLYTRLNVLPLQRLLSLARANGIRHAVVCGSYFTHFNDSMPNLRLSQVHPYIKSRVIQSEAALSFAEDGFHVAVLEFPYIFGVQEGRIPVWMFMARLIHEAKRAIFYPAGGSAVITAKQAGQFVAGALDVNRGGNRYPVGCYNLSWDNLLRIMQKALSSRVMPVIHIPKFLFNRTITTHMVLNEKMGLESGLNYGRISEILYSYMYIDETNRKLFSVEHDDIEGAIGDSIRLCYRLLDGASTAMGMRGDL